MYQILFYVGLACTIIFLFLSIFLFLKNHVAKLIGDVTGWNAKRAIKKISKKDREPATKKNVIHQERSGNMIKGSTTDKVNEKNIKNSHVEDDLPTEILPTDVGGDDEETALLAHSPNMNEESFDGDDVTTLLVDSTNADAEAFDGDDVTTMLVGFTDADEKDFDGDDVTTLLVGDETQLLVSDCHNDDVYEGLVHIAYEGGESILDGATEIEVEESVREDETFKLTSDMFEALKEQELSASILSGTEQPMPDIFQVEEDEMHVHTDDVIQR